MVVPAGLLPCSSCVAAAAALFITANCAHRICRLALWFYNCVYTTAYVHSVRRWGEVGHIVFSWSAADESVPHLTHRHTDETRFNQHHLYVRLAERFAACIIIHILHMGSPLCMNYGFLSEKQNRLKWRSPSGWGSERQRADKWSAACKANACRQAYESVEKDEWTALIEVARDYMLCHNRI